MSETMVPSNPVVLAPFDLSRPRNTPLEERARRLVQTYLNVHVGDGLQSDFDSRFYRAITFLLPFLDRNLPIRPRRILEIGCGKGAKSLALSLLCEEYHAIDIVPKEIGYAKEAAIALGVKNVRFSVDEAANVKTFLSDASDKYDLVILYAVLEHLTPEEKLEMLREVWRYLDDDGVLYIGETPNRMLPMDYHSTKQLYFQQMPLDLWPRYLHRVQNEIWREDMQRAAVSSDWKKAAYRRGVHLGHQEFDLALMRIEDLDRHVVADSYDVSMLNLYPYEFVEFLKLAELRSFDSFPDGVRIEPREFPDFFSRYWLETLLSKRRIGNPPKRVRVERPHIRASADLFAKDQFINVSAGAPLVYACGPEGETIGLTLQLFDPMRAGEIRITDAGGGAVANFSPRKMVYGFSKWRRNLAIELPHLERSQFPIRITSPDGQSAKVVGLIERSLGTAARAHSGSTL